MREKGGEEGRERGGGGGEEEGGWCVPSGEGAHFLNKLLCPCMQEAFETL